MTFSDKNKQLLSIEREITRVEHSLKQFKKYEGRSLGIQIGNYEHDPYSDSGYYPSVNLPTEYRDQAQAMIEEHLVKLKKDYEQTKTELKELL